MKKMIEDFKDRLNDQVSTSQESREDVSSHFLPAAPSDAESDESSEEQAVGDEQLAKSVPKEPAAKQEAIKMELEAVNEKLQRILHITESGPSFNVGHINNQNGQFIVTIGGYTNYGQHSEGNGQINNLAPQIMNHEPVYAHRQYPGNPGM
jgi:hypothetical protein